MKLNRDNGFTLIELIMIIILLGILSATAVVLVGNVLEQQKFDETVKEMNELKKAMLGNPEMISSGARSSFGSVGDIGALPSSLTALVEKGTLPVFQKTGGTGGYDAALPDLGTGAGWRGPYIDDKKDDSGNYIALRDGWGNAYTYNSATGQVTSTGGGAGNIVIPETSVAGSIYGSVSGQVRGNQGGAVEGATVILYYPNRSSPGNHRTSVRTTGSTGFYSNFTGIPIGRRTIKVTSGSVSMSDTVVVDGAQTQTKDFVIADQIAPNPPTSLIPARASYTSLSLSWTASTSSDTASYKIYRGTVSGGEVLYKTNITGTSYVDDNSGTGLTAGTTYYYRMSAVDTAGNESSLTTESNETVSPIQQSGLATRGNSNPGGGCAVGDRRSVDLTIINNDLSTRTVDFIQVTWSGGSPLWRIDSPTGTSRWSGTANSPSLLDVTNFNVASGATQTMRLYFCGGTDATNILLEFNLTTFDGSFTVAF